MKEILITSSVMILAVIALRFLFRKQVSRRVIYGAWLLVALRLLAPIQFGQLDFSVLTQAKPVTEAITEIAQKPISGPSREELYNDALHEQISQGSPVFIPEIQEQVDTEIQHSGRPAPEVYDEFLETNKAEEILLPEVSQQIETVVSKKAGPSLGQIALWVWLAGIFVMAGWFLSVNLSLHHTLRLSSVVFPASSPIPVKISPILASPCLFGLFRPAIYLTPACTQDDRHLRHVLIHEQTHLRHADHIWAWVRCLCLCIYWFDPLVWVAAHLSKRDCELACDEAALKILGEEERLSYGRTLVDMVAMNPAPGQLLETATAMHETKKQLKERVNRIVKKPKLFLTAAIALLLVLTIVTGCAFTGPASRSTGTPDSTTPTTNPTTDPTDPTTKPTDPTTVPTDPPEPTEDPIITEAQTLLSSVWLNQALTSVYGSAEFIDLYEFFYNGFLEESRIPTDAEWAQLKDTPGFRNDLVLIRLPVSKMNKTLQEYFNLTLSETKGTGLEKFTYLESTDCYYFMRAEEDTNAVTDFTITNVDTSVFSDTTLVSVYYTRDNRGQKFYASITLFDNKYTIDSNMIDMGDSYMSKFVSLPEPENYRYLFDLAEMSRGVKSYGRFVIEVILDDPDTFIKYAAFEEKGHYKTLESISRSMSEGYGYSGNQKYPELKPTLKRIAEDPTSTADEQYAAFQLLHWFVDQKEEREYRLQACEKKTPLDDYKVDTCLISLNPEKGWAPQSYPDTFVFDSFEQLQNNVASHKKENYYDMTVTNALCPESYGQLVSTYDDNFFKENVLLRIDLVGNRDTLPVVTKVLTGEETFWSTPLSVFLEYDKTNREDLMVYVLLIAIPREHYQPAVYHDYPRVDCVVNGEPRLWC